jgi:Protein of unknown function (DUF998)
MSSSTRATTAIYRPSTGSQRDAKPGAGIAARAGVIGVLVAALVALALAPLAIPESYSWVKLGLSEAAAQGVDGAWAARAGFILFGLAVVWLAHLRSAAWPVAATVLHLAFGVSMFGVAAFAHKPWEPGAPFVESEDFLHSVFASLVGFGFIGGVICVIIARRRRDWRAMAPDLVALAVGLSVPFTMSTGAWGVFQRLMFLTAACWYGREAWTVQCAREVSCDEF